MDKARQLAVKANTSRRRESQKERKLVYEMRVKVRVEPSVLLLTTFLGTLKIEIIVLRVVMVEFSQAAQAERVGEDPLAAVKELPKVHRVPKELPPIRDIYVVGALRSTARLGSSVLPACVSFSTMGCWMSMFFFFY